MKLWHVISNENIIVIVVIVVVVLAVVVDCSCCIMQGSKVVTKRPDLKSLSPVKRKK